MQPISVGAKKASKDFAGPTLGTVTRLVLDWSGEEHRVLQGLPKQAQHEPSAAIDLTRWAGSTGLAVAVGVVYLVAARLSLALLNNPEGVAVFWPAAGVSAGLLIALGPRARWPVVVGTMAATIVANLFGDRNLWSAVLFTLCNRARGMDRRSLLWSGFPAGQAA
jgi:hypothetical protein